MIDGEARNTIQPDDVLGLRFLHDGRLSPDGTQVVYAVSSMDEQNEEEDVALWLLSLEDGASRRLTAGGARDTNPRWSPDGRQIAFLSTRTGVCQIYLIAPDGGEARPLTALEQGVGGGPVWSPDGETIAFTAGPADPVDLESPYRVTRFIYRFDTMGYLDNVVQDIYLVSVGDGQVSRLTDSPDNKVDLHWSPDGSEILYTAALFPDSAQPYARLRVVNRDGDVREVVGEWGYRLVATWLPNGRQIAFVGAPSDAPMGSKNDLWLVSALGGEPECLTASHELGIGGWLQPDMPASGLLRTFRLHVSEDGEAAYVQSTVGGATVIYRVALCEDESVVPLLSGRRSCILLDANEQHLLYAVSSINQPLDLYLAKVDGTEERQLTHLNADFLAEKQLPKVEHLLFAGGDGVDVEGWFLTPSEGTPPYPTILYIHGGPHVGFGYLFSCDFQILAGAGYGVLLINHRGSTGYGDAFSTGLFADWGHLDYEDLMAGVDYAVERGLADPDRLGCCGISGGGNLSCWIVGHTERFKAAVPENPVTNFVSFYGVSDIGPSFCEKQLGGPPHERPDVYRRCSPITYAHRCTTPTLLLQGESDYRCPAEQSEQFYTVLKANGCTVEMMRFPNSFHDGSIEGDPTVRRAQNEALLDWMNRYVLVEQANQAGHAENR